MQDLGRALILLGVLLLLGGLLLLLLAKTGLPLGHLPGDLRYRTKNFSVYFPVVSCLLISVLLSLVLYLFSHWRK